MGILGTIFLLGLVYCLIVLMVMAVMNEPVLKAKTRVNSFFKEVFLTETPQQSKDSEWTYRIYIGMDANGYPLADVIENYFTDLNRIFSDFYFSNVWSSENCMVYSFIVDEPIMEIEQEQLYKLCQKRCNNIVHRIIHSSNPYFGHLPNLVAIQLKGNQLLISIAENDVGRRQNADYIKRTRMSMKKHSKKNCNMPIEEDWSE